MSNVLHGFGAKSLAMAASTTYYPPCFSGGYVLGDTKQTTEDYTAIEVQSAGVISNVCIYVSANDRAASTLRVRVNGANGNTAITITGSTTGQFEDSSNTDTADDGEELNYSVAVGSGGTTFAHNGISHLFAPSSGTVTILESAGRADNSGTADTYLHLTERTSGTTEANHQATVGVAGTLQRLAQYIVTNTRSDSTSFRSRINGATGNLIVTYAASATGIVRDDSNTDSIADGDEVNIMWDQNGGTGSMTNRAWTRIEFSATDTFFMTSNNILITTVANAITRYTFPVGMISANITATEADVQLKSNLAFTWSDSYSYVSANSINGTTTLRSRINTANGNQSWTYASTVTGQSSDTSNTDSVADEDEIDVAITTTGTTGTIAVRTLSSIGFSGAAGGATLVHRALMMGVGI